METCLQEKKGLNVVRTVVRTAVGVNIFIVACCCELGWPISAF